MDSGLAHAAGDRAPRALEVAAVPEVADVASAPAATHAVDVPGFRAVHVADGAPVTQATGPGGPPAPPATAVGAAGRAADAALEPLAGPPAPRVLPGLPPADVVSVPEAAGREALTRLLGYGQPAVTPGPVALSANGRVLFLVAPGGSEDLPELLDWLDWGGVQLDLAAYPLTGPAGLADPPVRWLHPTAVPLQRPAPAIGPDTPGTGAAAHPTPGLPEPPELIALLATIAAACHRLAVSRGGLPQGGAN